MKTLLQPLQCIASVLAPVQAVHALQGNRMKRINGWIWLWL